MVREKQELSNIICSILYYIYDVNWFFGKVLKNRFVDANSIYYFIRIQWLLNFLNPLSLINHLNNIFDVNAINIYLSQLNKMSQAQSISNNYQSFGDYLRADFPQNVLEQQENTVDTMSGHNSDRQVYLLEEYYRGRERENEFNNFSEQIQGNNRSQEKQKYQLKCKDQEITRLKSRIKVLNQSKNTLVRQILQQNQKFCLLEQSNIQKDHMIQKQIRKIDELEKSHQKKDKILHQIKKWQQKWQEKFQDQVQKIAQLKRQNLQKDQTIQGKIRKLAQLESQIQRKNKTLLRNDKLMSQKKQEISQLNTLIFKKDIANQEKTNENKAIYLDQHATIKRTYVLRQSEYKANQHSNKILINYLKQKVDQLKVEINEFFIKCQQLRQKLKIEQKEKQELKRKLKDKARVGSIYQSPAINNSPYKSNSSRV